MNKIDTLRIFIVFTPSPSSPPNGRLAADDQLSPSGPLPAARPMA